MAASFRQALGNRHLDGGTVIQTFSNPSFSSPTAIDYHDGCLLVVNLQLANIQGTPELPFRVSSVAVPTAGGAAPVAVAGC